MKLTPSVIITACLFSTSALAEGIRAELSMTQKSYSATEDVHLNLTLTNDEKYSVNLLKWYTADLGVKEAIFEVEFDGQDMQYLGAHYKRSAPTAEDYITLKAGESISYKVELSALYDLSQTGTYDIQYSVDSINLMSQNPQLSPALADKGLQGIQSNTLSIWIEGRGLVGYEAVDISSPSTQAGSISFTGQCSNSEQSSILTALNAAQSMANNSVNYLQTYPSSSRSLSVRYKTWFGRYSLSRWNRVTNNFTAIKDAIDNQSLTFDCSCNGSAFAYVYPSQPYKMYMCNAFWNAATTGTDSKAGTIIHELSHFNVVAGTDDLAYGQSNAKSLANRSPSRATRNADSHEYFAENTPYQN